MASAKVAITLDRGLLKTIDGWVARKLYPNRSQAIQTAIREKSERWKRVRLALESSKLKAREERESAEEILDGESWPEF